MNIDLIGKFYTGVLSAYFVISGFNSLYDIEGKLSRIGLSATTEDGKIAFILIYCSLMIGIGAAMALVYFASGTWFYSCIISVIIIFSFIVFRFVGSHMIGSVSSVQMSFIGVEIIEFSIGAFILFKSEEFRAAIG